MKKRDAMRHASDSMDTVDVPRNEVMEVLDKLNEMEMEMEMNAVHNHDRYQPRPYRPYRHDYAYTEPAMGMHAERVNENYIRYRENAEMDGSIVVSMLAFVIWVSCISAISGFILRKIGERFNGQ